MADDKPKGPEHLRATQFKPGQSGNPAGRTKGIDRIVLEEINAAVAEVDDPETKQKVRLNGWQRMARKLLELGLAGNVQAMKLLFERVGGYPKQNVKLDGDATTPTVNWDRMSIEDKRELLKLYERLGLLDAATTPTEH